MRGSHPAFPETSVSLVLVWKGWPATGASSCLTPPSSPQNSPEPLPVRFKVDIIVTTSSSSGTDRVWSPPESLDSLPGLCPSLPHLGIPGWAVLHISAQGILTLPVHGQSLGTLHQASTYRNPSLQPCYHLSPPFKSISTPCKGDRIMGENKTEILCLKDQVLTSYLKGTWYF